VKEAADVISGGVGLTARGKGQPRAIQFTRFLQSREGAAIFKKWGWMVP
jgi:accessory colonization factor AcfC